MDFNALYKQKLTSANEAVKVIKSGDWVDFAWGPNTPVALDKALAQRFNEDKNLTDVNFLGGVLMSNLEIFNIEHAEDRITWNSWHMSGIERKIWSRGFGFYGALRYSELPRWYRENIKRINVATIVTSPMDENGNFCYGLSSSHFRAVFDVADVIIVEVNKNMPRTVNGVDDNIHISEVDMIVEGENPPILEMGGAGEASEVDKKVARLIMEEIPNGACLQLGIGGMPNAVGSMIVDSDLKDLGVHTEMYVDAFVDIALAGKITGNAKTIDKGRQVFAFAAGTKKLYEYVNNNPVCMAAPVSYTNDVRIVSQIDNFISINNAVDIDLFGQVNAESSGTKHISGSGGQLDFVLGAYLSKGGKSFICCSSTFTQKDGTLSSRIRPTLAEGSIITDPRPCVHYFVTEYGKVNLKGLSSWQRAEAIISVAHPDFRENLIAEAEKLHIWRRSNKR